MNDEIRIGAEHALRIISAMLERHKETLVGKSHIQVMNLRRALDGEPTLPLGDDQ